MLTGLEITTRKQTGIVVLAQTCFMYCQRTHLSKLQGATISHFTHYSCVVIISFNTGLCWAAFSTISFGKLVFHLSVLSVLFVLNQMF